MELTFFIAPSFTSLVSDRGCHVLAWEVIKLGVHLPAPVSNDTVEYMNTRVSFSV